MKPGEVRAAVERAKGKKDGFVRIPRSFLTDVAPLLCESELKAALAIYTETVGRGLESNSIGLRTLESLSGLQRRSVTRTVESLESCGVISRQRDTGKPIKLRESTVYSPGILPQYSKRSDRDRGVPNQEASLGTGESLMDDRLGTVESLSLGTEQSLSLGTVESPYIERIDKSIETTTTEQRVRNGSTSVTSPSSDSLCEENQTWEPNDEDLHTARYWLKRHREKLTSFQTFPKPDEQITRRIIASCKDLAHFDRALQSISASNVRSWGFYISAIAAAAPGTLREAEPETPKQSQECPHGAPNECVCMTCIEQRKKREEAQRVYNCTYCKDSGHLLSAPNQSCPACSVGEQVRQSDAWDKLLQRAKACGDTALWQSMVTGQPAMTFVCSEDYMERARILKECEAKLLGDAAA